VAFLELQNGSRQGEKIPVGRRRLVIGRHPDCDLVLDEPAVSRQHAALVPGDGGILIEDLRSRNGTTVNGEPLVGSRRLEHGDEVAICGQRLQFSSIGRRRATGTTDVVGASDGATFRADDAGDAVIVSQLEMSGVAAGDGTGAQAAAKLRALQGLDHAIGASLVLDDVLPRLLAGLLEVFPQADRGFVLLPDQQGRLLLRARRLKREDDTGPLRLSMSLIRHVADGKRAILSADASADTRFRANESVIDCRIRSVMCVPVVREDGRLLGVVQVDSRDVRDGFTEADLDVLAGLAGRAARAIEQALAHAERVEREQIERDLELAQRVQQGLLPSRPPAIPGYEVFDAYEAARLVGGDFFGYVPLPDDRLAFVLADVSGKGVSAALLMARLSGDVRYCLASERDLCVAVARMNESFVRDSWDDRFVTLVVAVLDPRRHVATICNAGHLPAYLREPSGAVRAVADELGGLPLGMDAAASYRSCEVAIAPGGTLVLFSDGISEALDHEHRCYGLERIAGVLRAARGRPAELGRRLLADVTRHTAGQARSDDICLVCVGRVEPAGPAHPAQKPAPARPRGRVQADG